MNQGGRDVSRLVRVTLSGCDRSICRSSWKATQRLPPPPFTPDTCSTHSMSVMFCQFRRMFWIAASIARSRVSGEIISWLIHGSDGCRSRPSADTTTIIPKFMGSLFQGKFFSRSKKKTVASASPPELPSRLLASTTSSPLSYTSRTWPREQPPWTGSRWSALRPARRQRSSLAPRARRCAWGGLRTKVV
jgi:hypothetical protein